MGEQWKHVWGFSRYMVSDQGRVKSRETGLFVTQDYGRDGHATVVLVNHLNQRFVKKVCRVVMDAFDWQSGDYSQIYHDNNDKSDNRRSNLKRVIEHDNRPRLAESLYIGMDDDGNETRPGPRKKKEPKLTREEYIAVQKKKVADRKTEAARLRQLSYAEDQQERLLRKEAGDEKKRKPKFRSRVRVIETGEIFLSQAALSRKYKLDPSTVNKMLRGMTTQHHYKGLSFEYVDDTVVATVVEPVRIVQPNRGSSKPVRVVETGAVYPSQSALAKELGLNASLISRVLRGEMNYHKGYSFEYVKKGD